MNSALESACAIIVAWGPPAQVVALVARLRGQMAIRVCDNTGDLPELEGATVIRPGGNLGFGAGVNLASRGVDQEFLLLANPDTDLDARSAGGLVAALAAEPALAAVGPVLVYPDGSPQINGGSFSGPVRELGQATGLGPALRSLRARLRPEARERPPRLITRDWISGAAMALRREDFESVGGFDEGFRMYFEDEDLCRRLRARGRRCAVHTGVTVTHAVGGAYDSRDYQQSRVRYHRTHSGRLTARLSEWSARRRSA